MDDRRIDAVIFDLYGTLVDMRSEGEYLQALNELAEVARVPVNEFARVWRETHADRDLGRFGGLEEDIDAVFKMLGVQADPDRIAEVVRHRLGVVHRNLSPRRGAISTLGRLRSDGYKIGLVSGSTSEVARVWDSLELAGLVDVPVFSCTERMMKPDPRIYMTACRRLDVSPERCIFVGDGASRELTGAKAVGMYPILIRTGDDTEYDGMRIDALEWTGPRVTALPEIIDLVTSIESDSVVNLPPLTPAPQREGG